MNWLDLVLLVSAVSFAFSGYRQGFVVGVLAFIGFLGGGVLGLLLAPPLVAVARARALGQSLLAVGIVLLAATVGQVALGWVGALVRDRITWRPARLVDAGLGAAVSVLAMLLVAVVPRVVAAPGAAAVAVAARSATRRSSRPSTR